MVRLTEDMIVARTRVSDMNHVKKLNCWGAELSDISIIRKLTNVEVLSLSVNTISTLSDISGCKNLQELYIRKNQIPDIAEILWLKDLPRLKNLWLEENPCAEACGQELYRQTVIRNLPQLQKLDNIVVSSEEMAEAMRRGMELENVNDGGMRLQEEPRRVVRSPVYHQEESRGGGGYHQEEPAYHGRKESTVQSPSRRVSNQVFPEDAPIYSPSLQGVYSSGHQWEEDGYQDTHRHRRQGQSRRETEEVVEEVEHQTEYGRRYSTTQHSAPRRGPSPEEDVRRSSMREEENYRGNRTSYSGPTSAEPGPPYYRGQEMVRSPQSCSRGTSPGSETGQVQASVTPAPSLPTLGPHPLTTVRQGRVLRSPRPPSDLGVTSHSPSGSQASPPPAPQGSPTPEANYEAQAIVDHHYNNTYRQVDQQLESAQQLVAQRRSHSPQRPYPVRPKNRNSNVLSAILCLIKEIDGPSLEVVEMAVRCRMEELED